MSKKGISPLISVILLIGLTVAVVTIIGTYGKDLFKTTSESAQSTVEQFQIERQLNLILENATLDTILRTGDPGEPPLPPITTVVIIITNQADMTIDKFIVHRYKTDGTRELINDSLTANIGPFEQKELTFKYEKFGEADYFQLIPKIDGRATNYKIKFTPI